MATDDEVPAAGGSGPVDPHGDDGLLLRRGGSAAVLMVVLVVVLVLAVVLVSEDAAVDEGGLWPLGGVSVHPVD